MGIRPVGIAVLQAQDLEQQAARGGTQLIVDDYGRIGLGTAHRHGLGTDQHIGLARSGIIDEENLARGLRAVFADLGLTDVLGRPVPGQRRERLLHLGLSETSHEAHARDFRAEALVIESLQIVECDRLKRRFRAARILGQDAARAVKRLVENALSDRLRFGRALADVIDRPLLDYGERLLVPTRMEQHLLDQLHRPGEILFQAKAAERHRLAAACDPDRSAELSDRLLELLGRLRDCSLVQHLRGQISDAHLAGSIE